MKITHEELGTKLTAARTKYKEDKERILAECEWTNEEHIDASLAEMEAQMAKRMSLQPKSFQYWYKICNFLHLPFWLRRAIGNKLRNKE